MKNSQLSIAVVGGAGYIGSHVALELYTSQHKPAIIDNLSTGHRDILPADIPFFHADLLIPSSIKRVLSSRHYDAVIHLAAKKDVGASMSEPHIYAQANIGGSLNLLSIMDELGIPCFVFSSSAAVYGIPQSLPITEDHPRVPDSFYGYTKKVIEDNLDWYSRLKGFCYASLRYFNAVGYDPGNRIRKREENPSNLLPVIMDVLCGRRSQLDIYGDDFDTIDGTGVRDYIHVSDLARAHVLAVEYLHEKRKNFTVNLGTEQGHSVYEIKSAVERITHKKVPYRIVARRKGDSSCLFASAKRAKKLLDWQAQIKDLDQIVETTWQVYQPLASS